MEAQPTDVTGIQAPTEPVTQQQPEPPKEDSLAPKFAALAKKEKWVRKMMEDVKKQQDDLKKRDEEYKSNYIPKSRVKEDFMAVALEAGLTPDQIANILLSQAPGQPSVDPMMLELKNEIKALQSELHQTKRGYEESKKIEYDNGVNQIRNEATKMVASNPEFETIKAKGLVNKVVEYIESTYKEDGILLSTAEACKEVEEALVEDAIASFTGSKKIQERLRALQPKQEPVKPQVTQQQQTKTLTNGMTPSSNNRPIRDRRERAIMRAQGLDPDAVGA